MPFGLTNMPAVFQTLVNDVLGDMINKFVFVYLDDILIFSQDTRSHQGHVRKVLQRLMENRLFVKGREMRLLLYLHHLPGVHHLRGQHSHRPREGGRGGAVAPTW